MLARELWGESERASPLHPGDLAHVVRCAPLLCVDIIIRGPLRRVLVGLRNNEPAKGWYFFPGGRVRKDESIKDAFHRILSAEAGLTHAFGAAHFAGIGEHFYDVNGCGGIGFGTHCVTLCYEIAVTRTDFVPADAQHRDFKWLADDELIVAPDVHDYCKAYFR